MIEKKTAKIDVVKAIAGVSFVTLAAIGSSTGNPALAGLSALPAAGLASYDVIGPKIRKPKKKMLEVPVPVWWVQDARAWQSLCTEIQQCLPQILSNLQARLQEEHQIITRDTIEQHFIDALVACPLTYAKDDNYKMQIGECIVTPFLQELEETLTPLIQQMQHEGVLKDMRQMVRHTALMMHTLERIDEKIDNGTTMVLSDEENVHVRKQYCDALYKQWRMLDFKGIMYVDTNHPISIPLTEVFILPDELIGIPEYETQERSDEHFLYGSYLQQRTHRVTPQRATLHSILAKQQRLIFLGDPGSGKSTLLRYLLLQLALGSDEFSRTFPDMRDVASSVPLYMQLSAYAETVLNNAPGTRSLEDFLPTYLRDNYLGNYIDFIQVQLQCGNLLLLFDGLDEIPDVALRMKVVQHLEMFTLAHAANRFIVTSRIVGYKEAPLAAEYQVYTLADFSEEQVKAFTQRWCPAYEAWVRKERDSQKLADAATKEAGKLFDATQSRSGVKRLAVNPLLLTILAIIQRQGIELPSHRIELFDTCVMTLIDTWVKARGQAIQFSKTELIKILRPLAFWMHEHPAVGAIPEEDLHERIVQQLVGRGNSEHEASRTATQFLQTVRGKTGILVERGKQRYGFLHLTFEEYFAALELAKRKDKERDVFIKIHLHDPRWREVILLTVGVIGILQSDEEEVTELIQNTILRADSPYEWALHRDLLFAGQCLADDAGVAVDCEKKIIEEVVYMYLTSPYNSFRVACSSMLNDWSETKITNKAANLVLPVLQQWLDTGNITDVNSTHSPFARKIEQYVNLYTEHYCESTIKQLRFDLTILLNRASAFEEVDWEKNILGILSEESVRENVKNLIGQSQNKQPSITDILLAMLSDPDDSVRRHVIAALGVLGNTEERVVDALYQALFDVDTVIISINTIKYLHINQPHIIRALLTFSATYYGYAQPAALSALWELDQSNPLVIDILLLNLADLHLLPIQYEVTNVLSLLDATDQVRDIMLSVIQTPNTGTIKAMVNLLKELSSNSIQFTDTVASFFSNPANARTTAIKALGYLGKGQSHIIDILLSIISEPEEQSQEAAIIALGRAGDTSSRVLDALLHTITSDSWILRQASIRSLGGLGDKHPRVLDAIIASLSDVDDKVQEAAIYAFGELGIKDPRTIDILLPMLSYNSYYNPIPAEATLYMLGRLLNFEASTIKDRLVIVLSNSIHNNIADKGTLQYKQYIQESVGRKLLRLLKEVKSDQEQVIEVLFAGFSNSNITLMSEAARALGQLYKKMPHIADRLLPFLSATQWRIRAAAAEALGEIDKPPLQIIDALVLALSDTDRQVRANAALALTNTIAISAVKEKAQGYIIQALIQALNDPDSGRVRRYAALALGKLEYSDQHVTDALIQTLHGPSLIGRYGASVALAQLCERQPFIIEALCTYLSSEDQSIRFTAVQTLEGVVNKTERIVNALFQARVDPDWLVKGQTMRALHGISNKPPYIIDELLGLLTHPLSRIRAAAAYALKPLSNDDRHIISALLPMLTDSSWYVREHVAYTLSSTPYEIGVIGEHLEELLKRREVLMQRDLITYSQIFQALQEIAEKLAFKKDYAEL